MAEPRFSQQQSLHGPCGVVHTPVPPAGGALMASAGWYTDPQYEGWERYFDGKSWTDHRRPTQTPSWPAPLTPRWPESAAAGPGPDPRGAWTPPDAEVEAEDPDWWERPAREPRPADLPPPGRPSGEPFGLPPVGPSDEPFGVPRSTDPPNNGQSHTSTDPTATDRSGTATDRLTMDQPSARRAPTEGASSEADRPATAPRDPRHRRQAALRIAALAAVVVVLLAAAGVVVARQLSHPLTYRGRRIVNAKQVLAQAGGNVRTLVGQHHGVDAAPTRCYFISPAHPTPGARKSDVADTILCGPVLFVDGTVGHEYLRYGIRTKTWTGSAVTLVAGDTPLSNHPEALPSGYVLKRPDGLKPPARNGGLSVPPPPPATANELTSASLGSQTIPDAPAGAVIGSLNGGLRLTKFGTIKRYGSFNSARSAPLGQKLIAFRLDSFLDNGGVSKSLVGSTTVQVDGGTPRHLPTTTPAAPYYVIAVPVSATSVNLVVTDAGYTQTLSLLNGQPGSHNLTVLARTNRLANVHQTKPLTLKYSPAITGPHNKPQSSVTVSVTVSSAAIGFWTGSTPKPASSTSSAWLVPNYSYTNPDHPGQTFGLPPGVMTFTPKGGSPEAATSMTSASGKTLNAFNVPASVTSGTLTISGSFAQQATNGAHKTIKTTITTPISFTITFPS